MCLGEDISIMPINKRQSNTCSPGYSFYTCASTGFEGCCEQDACIAGFCPVELQDPISPIPAPQEWVYEYEPS